jgi:hypothetical protein
MMMPMGRRYQIDYMCGLRYVFSTKYRAKANEAMANNTYLRVVYLFGGCISIAVVTAAILMLTLALQGLLG